MHEGLQIEQEKLLIKYPDLHLRQISPELYREQDSQFDFMQGKQVFFDK